MTKLAIGVDIGTTSTKAVLFTTTGQIRAQHAVEYPLHTPNPQTAEQSPEDIYQAVLETIKETIIKAEIDTSQLLFISFSSAMHSLIGVDKEGKLLTNSITWADNRSAKWAEKIKNEWNGHDIYRRTGTPIHPMSPLSKLVWLKHEHKDLFATVDKWISIKEYILWKMFGEFVVDYSIASATGLFNLEQLNWDREALELAGVKITQLSTPVPTTHQLKGLKENLAEHLGIPASTPFVVGASDGVLSNLGVNAIGKGEVAVTIGTSGAIRTVVDKPITDPKGRIFCYALTENHWVLGGPVNNGGVIFRWIRDELGQPEINTNKEDPYDVLTRIASTISPGADGLLFHPYFTGERAPLWNAHAKGSFIGLTLHHQKAHMIRAALEGILFNLYTVLLALEELTGESVRIKATGGFAKSAFWRQMMSDIFQRPLTVPQSVESSCLGAVVVGLYALGEIAALEEVSSLMEESFEHIPVEEASNKYRELVSIFIRLSKLLEEEYKALSEFQTVHVQ
ncbi:gluconokinase [Mangrovibacillus cuniculi]|uniref:Gluconokinase n=1 Tax=Mangrovibacillus cuniculi TaxID=2593652 RepID=A0A7S8HFT2_9BACI|nr:gluconokinase [Mangrovibacillus cuniculi]QPC47153.1 gluconokinase [Mangrovibacillus cuniculi]